MRISRTPGLVGNKAQGGGHAATNRQSCDHHRWWRWDRARDGGEVRRRGRKVVIVDIDSSLGGAAARSVNERCGNSGGEAHFVQCDITVRTSVDAAVAEAVARFGKLHLLFN